MASGEREFELLRTGDALHPEALKACEQAFFEPADQSAYELVADHGLRVLDTAVGTRRSLPLSPLDRGIAVLCLAGRAAYWRGRHEDCAKIQERLLEVLARLRGEEGIPHADRVLRTRTTLSFLYRNVGQLSEARSVLKPEPAHFAAASAVVQAAYLKEKSNIFRYEGAHSLALSEQNRAARLLAPAHCERSAELELESLFHFRTANWCELIEMSTGDPALNAWFRERAESEVKIRPGQRKQSLNVPYDEKHKGFLCLVRGEQREARTHFEHALNRFRALGMVKGEALCLYTKGAGGLIHAELGMGRREKPSESAARQIELCVQNFEEAERLAESAKYARVRVIARLQRGRCLLHLSRTREARQVLLSAAADADRLGNFFLSGVAERYLTADTSMLVEPRHLVRIREVEDFELAEGLPCWEQVARGWKQDASLARLCSDIEEAEKALEATDDKSTVARRLGTLRDRLRKGETRRAAFVRRRFARQVADPLRQGLSALRRLRTLLEPDRDCEHRP
ncbi:MAG: hypothetical protein HYZ53_10085 [Planctomycetes bacterium]|nr:hypothetical protein [Planctomycetota bacterium]